MLAEVFHYLATPCSGAARRFGHLGNSIALWARAGRCRKAWAPHEARCHEAVAEAVRGLDRRRAVLVLGSGLLRDVDLRALEDAFETVILADVVHLPPVRLRWALHRRVRWETADLSGTHAWLQGRGEVAADPLAAWARLPGLDLVISANVLSQLPLAPADYAARRALPGRDGLGRTIVENHLSGLRGFPCRVCLLTDTAWGKRFRDGTQEAPRDLLFGAPLPAPPREWEWTLAPFGEASRDYEVVHRCRAYPDFRAAAEAGKGDS